MNTNMVSADSSTNAIGWTNRTLKGNLFWSFFNALRTNRICCTSVITCEATLIFTYDTGTKQLSTYWMSPISPSIKREILCLFRNSRTCRLLSSISRMLWWQSGFQVAKLSIITIISESWLNFRQRLRRKLPWLWRSWSNILQNKAPFPTALCVQQVFASKTIAVLAHLPNSPDHTHSASSFFQSSNPFSKENILYW